MTMREKIARTLAKLDGMESEWIDLHWREYLSDADAVLEAMMEPDEGMIWAGGTTLDHPSVYMGGPSEYAKRIVPKIYTAMLTAARSGG